MNEFHPSAYNTLKALCDAYPNVRFLALGQTVFWDEPMKAVLRRALDQMELGGTLVLGVHDTDYFAKSRVRNDGGPRFDLFPHNDGSTRDLWSAAGEISRLFGSETFPRRSDAQQAGIPLERLGAAYPGGVSALIDHFTEAWGWRGLVYIGSRNLVVNRLPLKEVADGILRLLKWGFDGTIEAISEECCRREAQTVADRIYHELEQLIASHPNGMLSDLFQAIYPRLLNYLDAECKGSCEVTSTTSLLRLTPETAGLRRFQFLDLFLNPSTRKTAIAAYNGAVAGSDIYSLDKFGLGAIPFDVVLPHHGRGSLRITLRAVHIETPHPLRIPLREPIENVCDLAITLNREFGNDVVVVGKAVALISMLATEYIFVFSKEGSSYVWRTRKMNEYLQKHGIKLDFKPILRLHYHTWDSLRETACSFKLPQHLGLAFGRPTISGVEFAQRWRTAMQKQKSLRANLLEIRRPRAILAFLAENASGQWIDRLAEYNRAKERLIAYRAQGLEKQRRVNEIYDRVDEIRRMITNTEKQMGDHFRATQTWTPEEKAARARFQTELDALHEERRLALQEATRIKAARLALEREGEAAEARATITRIENECEMERFRMLCKATMAIEGLPHSDHRPSAWWFPLVDRTGRWFKRVAETTEFYVEPIA